MSELDLNSSELLIEGEDLSALLIPAEGALLARLNWHGRSILASTPWAHSVVAQDEPAPDEDSWVKGWRGGWQLCAPTAGAPAPNSPVIAFHGEASQAKWVLENRKSNEATFAWQSHPSKIDIRRTWRVGPGAMVSVSNILHNSSTESIEVILAEHLILGGDLLSEVAAGESVEIILPQTTQLAALDYSGAPNGSPVPWSDAQKEWGKLTSSTPARFAAVTLPHPMQIIVQGGDWEAVISWHGLSHALIWQEICQSQESPWNGSVIALGIEPTSTPHGLGSNLGGGITVEPEEKIAWGATLALGLRE